MTIRDYIAAYNKTFGYVEEKYGVDMLGNLFSTISKEYCTHLEEYVRESGVEGCQRYWGGDSGTLSREKIDFRTYMEDGVFHGQIRNCTSVGDVRSRGQEPHVGKLTYCDHCQALYGPVCAKYGVELLFTPEYLPDGTCAGNCTWYAKKAGGK
ncbi:MAG: hypothetical protein RRZ24_06165 [Clostridia bacterium]